MEDKLNDIHIKELIDKLFYNLYIEYAEDIANITNIINGYGRTK